MQHKLEEKIRYLKKEFFAIDLTIAIKIDFKILGKKKKHGPGLEPGTFGFKSQHTTTAPLAHLFIQVYIGLIQRASFSVFQCFLHILRIFTKKWNTQERKYSDNWSNFFKIFDYFMYKKIIKKHMPNEVAFFRFVDFTFWRKIGRMCKKRQKTEKLDFYIRQM